MRRSTYKGRPLPPDAARTKSIYMLVLFLFGGVVVIWQAHWASQNREIYLRRETRFRVGPNASVFQECLVCNTHGRILVDEEDRMCPVCFGVGGNFVKRFDTGEAVCAYCTGQGRVFDTRTAGGLECRICEGRGAKRMPQHLMFCPECRGGGEQRIPDTREFEDCWLCKGRGMLAREIGERLQPPQDP